MENPSLNLNFDDESEITSSFADFGTQSLDLSHKVLFGEDCVESPFIPDSISDKIFRDVLDSDIIFPMEFNESLPNTVGRHVRSFNLKQRALNKPSYLDSSKKPNSGHITDEERSRYDAVIAKYDSLITKLRLNDKAIMSLITKPELVDVFPSLLHKFSQGETPVLDDTWMMNPRFVPSAIFEIMRKKGYFNGFSESKQERTLFLPNRKGNIVPVRYQNNYERENIIRIYMVKNTDDEDFAPIFANLRHYNFSIYYTCDMPRFYSYDTKLHTNAQPFYQQLLQMSFDEMKDHVFSKMMANKLFRYNFEDKNKEFVYFTEGHRSSYYRFVDLVNQKKHAFVGKKQINVLFVVPDKDFNDVSITGAIDTIVACSTAERICVTVISNLVRGGAYVPFRKENVLIAVINKSTTDFSVHRSQILRSSDVFFFDFAELNQVGSMIYGTHGKLNKLLSDILENNSDDIAGKLFFVRTSLTGSLFYFTQASEPFVQLFKAGGMTFQFATYFSKTKFRFDDNLNLLRKVASTKLMTDEDRKKVLVRGLGIKYLDRENPISDPVGFDLDCPKYNLTNAVIRPLSYCHSRATNKFTKKKEDLLQYYIDLKKDNGKENGLLKQIANSLIRNNFIATETISEMRQNYPGENITETAVKTAMKTVFKTSVCDDSLLRAIRSTLIDAQPLAKLRKICREINDHMQLFYKVPGKEDLYIFSGFIPDNLNNPDVLVSFFPELKDNTVYHHAYHDETPDYDPKSPLEKRPLEDDEETSSKK